MRSRNERKSWGEVMKSTAALQPTEVMPEKIIVRRLQCELSIGRQRTVSAVVLIAVRGRRIRLQARRQRDRKRVKDHMQGVSHRDEDIGIGPGDRSPGFANNGINRRCSRIAGEKE